MKKGMLHAYTYKSDKKVTFWFGKEGDAIFPLQTLYNNQAGYENIELLEDSVLYELSVDKLHDLYLADIHIANWGGSLPKGSVSNQNSYLYHGSSRPHWNAIRI